MPRPEWVPQSWYPLNHWPWVWTASQRIGLHLFRDDGDPDQPYVIVNPRDPEHRPVYVRRDGLDSFAAAWHQMVLEVDALNQNAPW